MEQQRMPQRDRSPNLSVTKSRFLLAGTPLAFTSKIMEGVLRYVARERESERKGLNEREREREREKE